MITATNYTPKRGDVVALPDGSVGEVTWTSPDSVTVVHDDRDARGPWHMHPTLLRKATDEEHLAYDARVRRRRAYEVEDDHLALANRVAPLPDDDIDERDVGPLVTDAYDMEGRQ